MPRYLVIPFLVFACAPSNAKPDAEKTTSSSGADSLALERTMCYGSCPAYRLRISAGGEIRFESRNPGETSAAVDTVPAATLPSLIARARSIGFFALPSEIAADSVLCRNRATDHSTVVVTVFSANETKSVQDYLGCRETVEHGVPRVAQLRAFEAEVDSVLKSSRWVRPASRR